MSDATNVFAVFSRRPDSVSPEEYDEWYRHHLAENIESAGFVGGQRFNATCVTGPDDVNGAARHLALYSYVGSASQWRASLAERHASGEIVYPPWFGEIGFTSWECAPLGGLRLPIDRSTD